MAEREFTIVRVLDATREEVFRAWTEPAQAARWFGPVGCTTPPESVRMDVRPGGEWRATMIRDSDGVAYPIGGVYRQVLAPQRLAFTWGAADRLGEPEQSLVTVTLVDLGGKTEMTFHQAGLDADEQADVREGWSSCLDRLAGHVGPAAEAASTPTAAPGGGCTMSTDPDLAPFVGHWTSAGRTVARPGRPAIDIEGTDDYTWLPGRHFLVHRVDVRMGGEQVDVLEVIGERDGDDGLLMRSFDHQGVSTTMRATVDGAGVWTFAGDTARATVRFAPDGRSMTARWESVDGGDRWEHWMDMEFVLAG